MDYRAGLEGYESNKLKKAKKLIEAHQDVTVIPESDFYDFIDDYLKNKKIPSAVFYRGFCCFSQLKFFSFASEISHAQILNFPSV